MRRLAFAGDRTALVFGDRMINLHQPGQEFYCHDPDDNLAEIASYP